MKKLFGVAAVLVLAGSWAWPAFADPHKDESGKDRWRGSYERHFREPRVERHSFKQEYDDGRCKYERKLEKDGEYKEEVKCRGGRYPASRHRY